MGKNNPALFLSFQIAFLFSFLLFFPANTQAQIGTTVRFETITSEDGLSAGVVTAILQDQDGFMWFGTTEGLHKYDGYEFTIFKPDSTESASISNKIILSLYEDRNGTLWVGTDNGGLNKFDPATETFTHYLHNPASSHSLSHNAVWVAYEDRHGVFWIGTSDGLNRFDPVAETFTTYRHQPETSRSLPENSIRAIYQDQSGTLWVGSRGGLHIFDPEEETFTVTYRRQAKDPLSLSDNTVLDIHQDQHGTLWIGTSNGLNKFNPEAETFTRYQADPDTPYGLADNTIRDIFEDQTGVVWLGTNKGLSQFVPPDETFTTYRHNAASSFSLSHDVVLSVYEDRAGVLWVGTQNGTLSKLVPTAETITNLQHNPALPRQSLSDNSVWSVYEDSQGNLWVGTTKGLDKIDWTTGTVTTYRHNPNDPASLSPGTVVYIFEDHQGTLWVSTDDGFNKFNPDSETFTVYRHTTDDPTGLPSKGASVIYEDSKGVLWVGTTNGLSQFDRETETFTTYHDDPIISAHLSNDGIWALAEDQNGTLWIGTSGGGLNSFDRETNTFNAHLPDPNNPNAISDGVVLAIHETEDGILWLGTFVGGLNRFDPKTDTFTVFTEDDGLANNSVWGILEDKAGHLWLSTNGGLSKFDPQSNTFQNYHASYGFPSDIFYVRAYHQNSSDMMFFGGPNGLTMFDPAEFNQSSQPPPVVLTSFEKFNQPVALDQPLSQLSDLTLSYQDDVISFEFAALDYTDPDRNQYKYKLEGVDSNWVEAGDRRFASYSNLDSGNHTFRVQAANSSGVWNEEGLAINITVIPPWWETWWARTLAVLTVLGIMVGGYKWRVSSIQAQNRQLELQVAHRTQELEKAMARADAANKTKSIFLTTMSHELRTPLNGVLGYAQILKRTPITDQQKQGLNVIEKSGKHLLALINDILDLAKIESGAVELHQTRFPLRSFLDELSETVRFQAKRKNMDFQLELFANSKDDDRLPEVLYGDDRRLRQTLINLLGNALKFTNEGHVTLRVSSLGSSDVPDDVVFQDVCAMHTLRFEVEDTGTGISPEDIQMIFTPFQQVGDQNSKAEGTGLGLAICRNLVELMGGALHVKSQLGTGSTFWFDLTLPVVDYQLRDDNNRGPSQKIVGIKTCHACGSPNPTALVVDDNRENRAVIVDLLSPLGFLVDEAINGRDGLSKFKTAQPDILITDLVMPDMDGFQLIRQVRQLPDAKNAKIIAASASVYREDQQRSLTAGSDTFLPKPIESNLLFEKLQQLLNIEWTYRETFEDAKADSDSLVLPPAETLDKLLQLTEMGDVEALQQQLAILSQSNREYEPFVAKLDRLLQTFKLNELADLLGMLLRNSR